MTTAAKTLATAGATPARRPARPRRYDPDRRDRIIDATVAVMSRDGIAATTHRGVAAEADVPLGSLTYHFHGLDELRVEAFQRIAARMFSAYEEHFREVEGTDAFIDAVTELIHGHAGADSTDWAVAYELYLAALRDPALRSLTESWMRSSRTVLERFVDPLTARGVDALIEGLVMHRMLSTAPPGREVTSAMVSRLVRGAGA
jgi:DNA-binding transcriptional regulator YbjK